MVFSFHLISIWIIFKSTALVSSQRGRYRVSMLLAPPAVREWICFLIQPVCCFCFVQMFYVTFPKYQTIRFLLKIKEIIQSNLHQKQPSNRQNPKTTRMQFVFIKPPNTISYFILIIKNLTNYLKHIDLLTVIIFMMKRLLWTTIHHLFTPFVTCIWLHIFILYLRSQVCPDGLETSWLPFIVSLPGPLLSSCASWLLFSLSVPAMWPQLPYFFLSLLLW